MQDSAKYLVHADITAEGVVERNDVVGAVFGQTEGLLGEELEIRDLQESSKVGRIDVEVESQHGQSFGELTIATNLDKVETAILAAALETIDRVGPCRASISVRTIEDVRAAKRREIVEGARRLLAESFEGSVMSSDELVDAVRQSVRVEDIAEYEGYPAGPRVADSDAIVVVEGRADVLQLLKYGVKNAVAVEGTNVPEPVAELTRERTVTAFLDGDRGGDLILKELGQVGSVDYVAHAPAGRSVEDLDREEVMDALRGKVPYEEVVAGGIAGETDATDVQVGPADNGASHTDEGTASADPEADGTDGESGAAEETDGLDDGTAEVSGDAETEEVDEPEAVDDGHHPRTLGGHARAVVGGGTGTVRLLDDGFEPLGEGAADEAFELVREADPVPTVVVLDGELGQRLLDICAQRGVGQVVARAEGEFVKRPASVRVRTADRLLRPAES
jgi:DNA primase